MYVARNQLPAEGNYLPDPHNLLPRLGYRLRRMPDLLPPSGNHLPRPCNGLPVRSNGLVRMYDYLSRALYWWFPGLQKTFAGMLSHW
ncbi:hypothetical protein ACXR0O_01650 [Verrucomicrobiota bacterium sgz303538]